MFRVLTSPVDWNLWTSLLNFLVQSAYRQCHVTWKAYQSVSIYQTQNQFYFSEKELLYF